MTTRIVEQAPAQPAPESHVVPMPEWRWRTFPVFFALAVGLFLGTWGGVAAGIVASGEDGNSLPMNLLFIFSAVIMGLALSRFMTRWMISRQWVKPKARPKAARRR
ncbi:MAG: hypothetical protein M0R74_10420 [Dehalococcoidia bacterium]|nr:hypothetical protein [Dehalococcoidia bacterium]